ncbi:MAG: hypothetical protein WBQ23_02495 [Bacteroidota bacterium]
MNLRLGRMILCLFLPLILSSCSDDPVNEPYDDVAIRVLVYRAMYDILPLDTLGCEAMAVALGDSLKDELFWPTVITPHSQQLITDLALALPLRIVAMDEVEMVWQPTGYAIYRTIDTQVPAVACFTASIERVDGTHLIVTCGMRHRDNYYAYAACDLVFENDGWNARAMNVYYSRRG